MLLIGGLCFSTLALNSCGHRASVSRGYSEGSDVEGNDSAEYSSDVEFGSAVEMRFQDTEAHLREGRFEEAIRSAQSLFRDYGLDREKRAKALLLWAQAEGSALNPSRDVDSATARLELLIDEYAHTDVASEAQRTLRRFRDYQKDHAG